jgi:hypothetical protein
MPLPTLEQYNTALQCPKLALVDPQLKTGTVKTTGLGLPLALCGGFALTYTVSVSGRKYAVRCFHKKSNDLETRYRAITNRLAALHSPYFIQFEFQTQGVRIDGRAYPVVKMEWASGDTLGEFLESEFGNRVALERLRTALRAVAQYLDSQRVAHGDIQPGNVMVSGGGATVQLIDYDGMFVEDLRSLGSAELGLPNFQHPRRKQASWDPTLDRFSFIALDLALRVLESDPGIWSRTQSDSESVLFRASDFANPSQSSVFRDLLSRPQFAEDAKALAAICCAPFSSTPTLEDFIARRNIPASAIAVGPRVSAAPAQYVSAYPVLDGTNYILCLNHVGDRVELIGRVVDVKQAATRYGGKPYIFVNFGPWKGNIVKITIWSDGLSVLSQPPDDTWVGKWVSVVGLMEPPYVSSKYGYSHLSITITQAHQMRLISEVEAKFRLSGRPLPAFQASAVDNQRILDMLHSPAGAAAPPRSMPLPPVTRNQAILKEIRGTQPTPPPVHRAPPAVQPRPAQPSRPPSAPGGNLGCLTLLATILMSILVVLAPLAQ